MSARTPARSCELCDGVGGVLVWSDEQLRVVRVEDASYPGFMRVIWTAHVREMSDLPESDRDCLMRAVWSVERALRELLAPDKINLASLGNMTAHLHWHVIPRFRGDPHFPDPIWAPARDGQPVALPLAVDAFEQSLAARLAREIGSGRGGSVL
jgi:diadenosine tetraphosphate (Ap4A) HIT family hydrolase